MSFIMKSRLYVRLSTEDLSVQGTVASGTSVAWLSRPLVMFLPFATLKLCYYIGHKYIFYF